MAYRMITQVVLTGARVLGRAFTEAYRHAQASSAYTQAQAKSGSTTSSSAANTKSALSSGMTLDEATKILNVKPPKGKDTDLVEVHERFKRLFDANDPKKGGSFYLQSKVLRARERIEAEVKPFEAEIVGEKEIKKGLPKMYKDR